MANGSAQKKDPLEIALLEASEALRQMRESDEVTVPVYEIHGDHFQVRMATSKRGEIVLPRKNSSE